MTKEEVDILIALDRVSVIISHLDDAIGFYDKDDPTSLEDVYPGIRSERALQSLSVAQESLNDLYQALGEDLYYAGENNG